MANPRDNVERPVLVLYVGAFRAEVSPEDVSRRIRVGLHTNSGSNSSFHDVGPRDTLRVDDGRYMLRLMLTEGQIPGRLPRVLTSVTVSVVNGIGSGIATMRADGINVGVSRPGVTLVLTNPRVLTSDQRNIDAIAARIRGAHQAVFGSERGEVLGRIHVVRYGPDGALLPTAIWRREWGHLEFAHLGNTVAGTVECLGRLLSADKPFVRARMTELSQRRRSNRYAISAQLGNAGVDLERTIQLMLRACGKYASDENVGATIQDVIDASVIHAFVQFTGAGQFLGNRNNYIDAAVLRVREMEGLVGPEHLPVPQVAVDASPGLEGGVLSAGAE